MLDFPQSLNLTTVLYMALASIFAWVGGWLKGRKKDHAEVRRIDAEVRQLHTTAEISPVGITLETLREIQAVIQKAEQRREEWHLREEQMRGQILHWRGKAEELDGDLIAERDTVAQMETRARLHEHQIKKMKALLDFHNISYAELDHHSK